MEYIYLRKIADINKNQKVQVKFLVDNYELQNLWKLSGYFKNEGSVSIIGKGEKKDILDEFVEICIPEGFDIIEIVNGDTKVRTSNKDQPNYQFKKLNSNVVGLSFDQIFPNESVYMELYLEDKKKKYDSIKSYDLKRKIELLRVRERDLIDVQVDISNSDKSQLNRFLNSPGYLMILFFASLGIYNLIEVVFNTFNLNQRWFLITQITQMRQIRQIIQIIILIILIILIYRLWTI